ncbi:MAG TPA: MarC family protein [Acetobacteraceae bacterium]|nr:MarC family protein [Acetobacteraceae bacterium]
MITPAFIFTVFMLTLGPVRTVPAFFAMTRDAAPATMRALALKGTATATAISLVIALVMTGVAASWRVSPDDLRLAGGILLFAASREAIGQFSRPAAAPQPAMPPAHPAVTPLAIPTIVTPWGVTAILFFADLAFGDSLMLATVIGILLLVMLLNLIGMMLARQIISRLGTMTFQVLGWIFAVLQAGLAVDAVVSSLRNRALFHPV